MSSQTASALCAEVSTAHPSAALPNPISTNTFALPRGGGLNVGKPGAIEGGGGSLNNKPTTDKSTANSNKARIVGGCFSEGPKRGTVGAFFDKKGESQKYAFKNSYVSGDDLGVFVCEPHGGFMGQKCPRYPVRTRWRIFVLVACQNHIIIL